MILMILWIERSCGIGYDAKLLAILKSMYSKDSLVCEVNRKLSRPVFPRRGLRQGCNLSSVLFAIYLSDLTDTLKCTEGGIKVWDVLVNHLCFAENIILIAENDYELENFINIMQVWCDKYGLNISQIKSQVVSDIHRDMWPIMNN